MSDDPVSGEQCGSTPVSKTPVGGEHLGRAVDPPLDALRANGKPSGSYPEDSGFDSRQRYFMDAKSYIPHRTDNPPRRCKHRGCSTWLCSYNPSAYCCSHGGWMILVSAQEREDAWGELMGA